MDNIKAITKSADSIMKSGLSNPYVMAAIKIVITLYAAQLAPRLPESVSSVFQNTFVKILALFIIAYISELDFQLAIILAVVFVFGANISSGRGILESFADFSTDYKSSSTAKLIEPKSMIYPGCQDITIADLEKVFDGDAAKMQKTIMYAYHELLNKMSDKSSKEKLMKLAYALGLPYSLNINDENAPLIATLLMYHGFQVSDKCTAPN
jgi:hypothetical protein